MRLQLFFLVITAASLEVTTPSVSAQQSQALHHPAAESAQQLGPHQGTLQSAGGLQTETVVTPIGLKIYVYADDGQPVSVAGARGVARLTFQGSSKRYRYDLFPIDENSLKADVDLSKIAGRQITVDYQLVGISRRTISYRDVAMVPADRAQAHALAIARQKICPVSGKPLGSMGQPIAVDVGGQQLFVCCAGCVAAVKDHPEKYIATRPNVEIVPLTAADAPLIAKQGKCPVMDESLGSMGQPVKLLVGGKPIYLCCKGCTKKVQADPNKYLTLVYGKSTSVAKGSNAVRPGIFKVDAEDQPFIAAQKKCPVMDEPLDAMGGPYKVHANGRAIYICCPGCAKKIAAEPDRYLTILAQQGVDAPKLR